MRQLNLLLVLVNAPRPLSRADIFEKIPEYGDPSDPTAQRKFERDKSHLREYVVFNEVKGDGDFADTYSIDKSKSFIELDLEYNERILIALAIRAWRDSGFGNAIGSMRPLAGHGLLENPQVLASLGRDEHHLAAIESGLLNHKILEFEYFSRHSGEISLRRVHPWRLALYREHWYLHGFDEIRATGLIFRLSRIVGEISQSLSEATESAPENLDTISEIKQFQQTESSKVVARILVPQGDCANLRLKAKNMTETESGDVLEIEYDDAYSLALDVAVVCDRVQVLEPSSLVERVSLILNQVLAVHQ